jgi:polysaccharide biosynthesis protein PslH
MRILSLSPRQCWPPVSGAKLREFYLLKALGVGAELTHLFFRDAGFPPPSAEELPFCARAVAVAPPHRYTLAKTVTGLLGRAPLSIVNYLSPGMEQALRDAARSREFELVHIEGLHMAGYVPLLRSLTRAPIVFDWHNIESEAMARFTSHVDSPLKKLYGRITARRLAALERQLLHECFGHIVCSERERGQLLGIDPRARIATIENGVDTRYFEAPAASPHAPFRLVFVGSMDYHANVDAAVYFARAVWPAVRAAVPALTLTLVGANPSPAVRALANEGGVEVTGTVPDVRPYYGEAVAAIVPLRVGGGTRLKILEAMAAGVPVISTGLGAEGLAISTGGEYCLAETAEDWVRQVTRLACDASARRSLADAARELVRKRYEWEALGATLRKTYGEWLGSGQRR